VSFYNASDFDTMFDDQTGFGDTGTLNPSVGSSYELDAVIDESVNVLDDDGNVVQRVKVLIAQRSKTNDSLLVRGTTWTRISDGKIYTIQTLEESDEHIDLYIVTR